ncbi:MAG: transporter associated domain-containing protein [Sumerlaeia bacterium]
MIAWLGLVLGVLLRLYSERAESRHLLGFSVYLSESEESTEQLKPETVSTVIDRLRYILATTKFLRFVALAFIAPAIIFLVKSELEMGFSYSFTMLFWLTFLSFTLLVFTTYISRIGLERSITPENALPLWVTDREEQIPILFSLIDYIWERLFILLSILFGLFNIKRPVGYLFESDGHFRLALTRDASPQEEKSGSGTVLLSNLQRSEQQMIHGIQRLDQTLVREIMKPINQVTAIRLQDFTPERFLELCRVAGYTRIPCYYDHVTNLVGYVNVYDVLELEEMPESLESLITKPLFVPEVAHVDNVLQLMMNSKKQVAIIFDEFGGTCGWLSREDIVEEIVGEVEDEFERPKNMIQPKGDVYLVDPLVDLDDLEEQLGLSINPENCDTLGGYIYYILGRSPRRGEELEIDDWKIRVTAMDDFRIRKLSLHPPVESEE